MSLEDHLKFPAPPTMALEAILLADQIFESNRASHSSQESGPSISWFNNCVKCQKDKTAQFIADTGASNTFTFDKNDFITFVEDNGTIQTAGKKAVLQVQGYGTVFIKHDIMLKGK